MIKYLIAVFILCFMSCETPTIPNIKIDKKAYVKIGNNNPVKTYGFAVNEGKEIKLKYKEFHTWTIEAGEVMIEIKGLFEFDFAEYYEVLEQDTLFLIYQ